MAGGTTGQPKGAMETRAKHNHRHPLGLAELLSAALGNQLSQVLQSAKLLPALAGAALKVAKTALAELRAAAASAWSQRRYCPPPLPPAGNPSPHSRT